jgi:nucleotide-binding universal stress UspA family protein
MTSTESKRQCERVVVGIDGSPVSISALRWAAGYASATGRILEVVVVWDWYRSPGWYVPILIGLDPEGDAKHVLEKALIDLESDWTHLSTTSRVVEGNPAPILVDASRDASMLVVGCRGHGEFAGMLLGSVSEYCATHARCRSWCIATTSERSKTTARLNSLRGRSILQRRG